MLSLSGLVEKGQDPACWHKKCMDLGSRAEFEIISRIEYMNKLVEKYRLKIFVCLVLLTWGCIKTPKSNESVLKNDSQTLMEISDEIEDLMDEAAAKHGNMNDPEATYWPYEYRYGSTDSEMVTFIFKKYQIFNRSGPDIIVEWGDESPPLHLFLNSETSLRVAFTQEPNHGPILALKAFGLLSKAAIEARHLDILKLANSLAKLGEKFVPRNGLGQIDIDSVFKPKRIKYRGKGNNNKACWVETKYDENGDLLNASISHNDEQPRSPTFYFYGRWKIPQNVQIQCKSTFEFPKGSDFSSGKVLGLYGALYERNSLVAGSNGTIKAKKMSIGGLFGFGAAGGGCSREKLEICGNSASLTSVSFGGVGLTFFPLITGAAVDRVEVQCSELTVMEKDY